MERKIINKVEEYTTIGKYGSYKLVANKITRYDENTSKLIKDIFKELLDNKILYDIINISYVEVPVKLRNLGIGSTAINNFCNIYKENLITVSIDNSDNNLSTNKAYLLFLKCGFFPMNEMFDFVPDNILILDNDIAKNILLYNRFGNK